MSAKHTPGPWSIDHVDSQYPSKISVGDNYGYVALVDERGIPGMQEANARLIAAAPDLLEALEGVLGTISKSEEWWIDSPNKGGFDVQAIRAAIAKAKGE